MRIAVSRQGMQFTKSYIKKSKKNLAMIKGRSEVPFYIIDSIFSLYRLPNELRYLAVIESELKASALSRVGAMGPWQLMPETAHVLGLKTGTRHDERRNYYKSTRAAARYLKDLYAEFGDWLLVIAAYNGGPGPVNAAISRSGSRNFWKLQHYLPAESRQHVKRFIATAYYFEEAGNPVSFAGEKAPADTKPEQPARPLPVQVSSGTTPPETENEKFHRLMQASAESLRRAGELLREQE
jgi:membrane-bound lytic murein transglycosylase D